MKASEQIKQDFDIWKKEYIGKQLRIGFGGLTLLLLILRCVIKILEHLEEKDEPSRKRELAEFLVGCDGEGEDFAIGGNMDKLANKICSRFRVTIK